MGFSRLRFQNSREDVLNKFECAYCLMIADDPVVCPNSCKSLYCRKCAQQCGNCPFDDKPMHLNKLAPMGQQDKLLYEQQELKCKFIGCTYVGKPNYIHVHEESCDSFDQDLMDLSQGSDFFPKVLRESKSIDRVPHKITKTLGDSHTRNNAVNSTFHTDMRDSRGGIHINDNDPVTPQKQGRRRLPVTQYYRKSINNNGVPRMDHMLDDLISSKETVESTIIKSSVKVKDPVPKRKGTIDSKYGGDACPCSHSKTLQHDNDQLKLRIKKLEDEMNDLRKMVEKPSAHDQEMIRLQNVASQSGISNKTRGMSVSEMSGVNPPSDMKSKINKTETVTTTVKKKTIVNKQDNPTQKFKQEDKIDQQKRRISITNVLKNPNSKTDLPPLKPSKSPKKKKSGKQDADQKYRELMEQEDKLLRKKLAQKNGKNKSNMSIRESLASSASRVSTVQKQIRARKGGSVDEVTTNSEFSDVLVGQNQKNKLKNKQKDMVKQKMMQSMSKKKQKAAPLKAIESESEDSEETESEESQDEEQKEKLKNLYALEAAKRRAMRYKMTGKKVKKANRKGLVSDSESSESSEEGVSKVKSNLNKSKNKKKGVNRFVGGKKDLSQQQIEQSKDCAIF